jgi:hypothetical protein
MQVRIRTYMHVCLSKSTNIYVQETGIGSVSAVTCALDGSLSQQAVLSLCPLGAVPSGASSFLHINIQ